MDLSSLEPRADLLAAALILDLAVGDPVYRGHPVRLIGGSLTRVETRLRPVGAAGRAGGCVLFAVLALVWGGGAAALVAGAALLHPAAAAAVHLFLLYSLVALGDLLAHADDVDAAVTAGDLAAARAAAGRLVGRDTALMDGPACRRSAVESLGESLVDGVVSPIFWYAAAGIPGLVLFKTVSTMDSMVGYRTARYRDFGWCGARLDDLLNLIPARMTWLLVAGAAALVMLSAFERAPAVAVAAILCREFLVSGLREALAGGATLTVRPLAKWKTAAQMGAISLLLAAPAVAAPAGTALATAGEAALWLAVALTWASAGAYLRRALPSLSP